MILTSASQLQFEHKPGYDDGNGYGYGYGDGIGDSYGGGGSGGCSDGNGYGDGDGYGYGTFSGDKFITVVDAVTISPLRFVVEGGRVGFWDAWEAATEEEKKILIQWMPVVQGTTND